MSLHIMGTIPETLELYYRIPSFPGEPIPFLGDDLDGLFPGYSLMTYMLEPDGDDYDLTASFRLIDAKAYVDHSDRARLGADVEKTKAEMLDKFDKSEKVSDGIADVSKESDSEAPAPVKAARLQGTLNARVKDLADFLGEIQVQTYLESSFPKTLSEVLRVGFQDAIAESLGGKDKALEDPVSFAAAIGAKKDYALRLIAIALIDYFRPAEKEPDPMEEYEKLAKPRLQLIDALAEGIDFSSQDWPETEAGRQYNYLMEIQGKAEQAAGL